MTSLAHAHRIGQRSIETTPDLQVTTKSLMTNKIFYIRQSHQNGSQFNVFLQHKSFSVGNVNVFYANLPSFLMSLSILGQSFQIPLYASPGG